MKKLLLLMTAAAFVVATAGAQSPNRSAKKVASKSVVLPATSFQKHEAVSAKQAGKSALAGRTMGKQVSFANDMLKDLKPAKAMSFRAATVQSEYIATGFVTGDEDASQWTMKSVAATESTPAYLVDVIPNCFGFEEGVPVDYTIKSGMEADTIIIEPQLVASLDSKGYYMFINDYNADDGVIRLAIDENGSILTKGSVIEYSVFSANAFDPSYQTYLGYWQLVKNVGFRLPSEPALAPQGVLASPANTVLFAGLGVSGYSYNSNLAMLGAYTTFTLSNSTMDYASEWQWNGSTTGGVALTANTRNLAIETFDSCFTDISLVGINGTAASEPFTWGYGHALNSNGDAYRYSKAYFYAAGMAEDFQFSDGTFATMTTQNPDGQLTFYTNWGTPDKTSTSMTRIYSYQGKPAAPLYLEGVTLPFVGFSATDEFNLHVGLYKCTRSASGTFKLGELIAEANATKENVNDEYAATSGLTMVDFNEFYVEDESGMTTTLDHLFIEDEFVVVIDDWDNGTFSGVLGSQDIDMSSIPCTYFARTGYPTEIRRYTSWFPSLFIGLKGAAFGFLQTEDNTDMTIAAEGGEAKIHVKPMLYTIDDENTRKTRLFLEDNIEGNEIPEWLQVVYTNPVQTGTDEEGNPIYDNTYDLIFKAEALPEGVTSRQATLVFFQEGAQLKVTVTQGESTGIAVTKTEVKAGNAQMFNLAGQRVSKDYKGLVIKNGAKIMNK